MKNILSILLLSSALGLQAKENELKTTITDVTVFQSGAQVFRKGEVSIPAGEQEIIISDATPLLKKESIQIKSEGDFTVLSVDHRMTMKDVDDQHDKWSALEARQKELLRQMEELSVKIQVQNAREKTVQDLENTKSTTKGITVEQISAAQETVRIKLAEIKNEKLRLSRQVLELFEEYKTVTQHLVALKTPRQNVRYEIVIKVLAKSDTKGKFEVNYIVPNASWHPTYDLRVNSIKDPMTIEYKANVSQQTGEDWSNIKLKLSTGDPSLSSDKPKIESWWLYLDQEYVQPRTGTNFFDEKNKRITRISGVIVDSETGAEIPWCSVMLGGGSIGTIADEQGRFALVLPENAKQLYVYCVGYDAFVQPITSEKCVIRLHRQNMPLNGTVKTDYEKQLMTLQSPVFNTDYENGLMTLDVPVDPQYEMDGDVKTINSYGMMDDAEYMMKDNIQKLSSMNNTMNERDMLKYKVLSPTITKTLNIVSTEFTIEERYTILSEPKSIAVPVESIQAAATYQYFCAPRYDKDVFLTAQLVDWEQYNLLEGQANVFFEGTFIGNTYFDTRYLVDTLEVSLGRDKSIKVERVKARDYDKQLVVGSDQVAYRQWDISVRNTRQQPVNIVIQDQFPVSSDSKIDVTQEEMSGGEVDEKTGIVTWDLRLDPSVTQQLQLKYKVKYPKADYVGLE